MTRNIQKSVRYVKCTGILAAQYYLHKGACLWRYSKKTAKDRYKVLWRTEHMEG